MKRLGVLAGFLAPLLFCSVVYGQAMVEYGQIKKENEKNAEAACQHAARVAAGMTAINSQLALVLPQPTPFPTTPTATDEELINAIKDLFKGGDKIPGGTAQAIRNEAITCTQTKGRWHFTKGQEYRSYLQKILRRPLNEADSKTAQALLKDLDDALDVWRARLGDWVPKKPM